MAIPGVALVLAACVPPEPNSVALCRYAVDVAVKRAGLPAPAGNAWVDVAGSEEVRIAFERPGPDAAPGQATCRVTATRHGVRLRALRLNGDAVAPGTLEIVNVNWHSRENASKLYQL